MNRHTERRLLWDACYNVRDLGGLATKYRRLTRWRAFVRADNLARLSPVGQQALNAYGVKTIIDLRSAYELTIDPPPFAPLCGRNGYPLYLNLPLLNEDDQLGMALINQTQSLAKMYRVISDRFQANIVSIMTAIVEASEGTVLFHCHSGRDRTGLIAALLLALAGIDALTIAEDYAISNIYLQPTFEKSLTLQPDIMLDWLGYLDDQYGGVQTYLLKAGMRKQQLDQIQAKLVGE